MPKPEPVYDENGYRIRPDGTYWYRGHPDGSPLIRPYVSKGDGMIAPMHGVKHGGFSSTLLSTVADEVAEELIGKYPWVLETDEVAIMQYCRAEARVRLLNDHVMKLAEEQGVEKVPPYLWGEVTKAENNAMRAADSLGLSPLGRMKIAKDAGFAQHFSQTSVGTLAAQGKALRAAGQS